tara:strand:+ start:181 stop:429 length:249 start_codon:yes stop_codon:yes gene_type:complete
LKILYFAKLKQHIGKSSDSIKISGEKRIYEVINELKKKDIKYMRAFEAVKNLQYAVNCEYVEVEGIVKDKDELAIFPPVTGG